MSEEQDLLVFNGINGATGDYLLPPMSPHDVSQVAQGEKLDPTHVEELKQKWDQISQAHFAPVAGIDTKNLAETGWAAIFARDADPAVREALEPLLKHRREQAGPYYKEYGGPDGYRPDETKQQYLARLPHCVGTGRGVGPGPADPKKVPYYLLIVGSPDRIPYSVQYQIDVQYAVGRIHFDTPDEYDRYARSVVQAETDGVALPRKAALFGVRNPGDRATQTSAEHLIRPLGQKLTERWKDWEFPTFLEADATKTSLGRLLGGDEMPALLFSASHGMGFPNGDPRQLAHQGALLCQDWPGPFQWRKPIPQDFYFAGDDVSSDASLLGLMAFFFACYGAGTPRLDDFAHQAVGDRAAIAPHAFLARLPQRLLGHPRGGALAVVGHVERAWGYSFLWGRTGEQLAVFESAFTQLLSGQPIGAAVEYFNQRYAELSSDLSSELYEIKMGRTANDSELSGMWTANNDARSYVILGDPAVRLPVAERPDAKVKRTVLCITTPRPSPPNSAPVAAQRSVQTPTAAAPTSAADLEFGLIGDAIGGLRSTVQQLASRLIKTLASAVDDVANVEVSTYASDRMDAVTQEQGKLTGAKLRAYTRISLTGDIVACVPEENGAVDQKFWAMHLDLVQQAQTHRTEMLRTAVAAAGSLLNLVKVG